MATAKLGCSSILPKSVCVSGVRPPGITAASLSRRTSGRTNVGLTVSQIVVTIQCNTLLLAQYTIITGGLYKLSVTVSGNHGDNDLGRIGRRSDILFPQQQLTLEWKSYS